VTGDFPVSTATERVQSPHTAGYTQYISIQVRFMAHYCNANRLPGHYANGDERQRRAG